VDRTRRNLAGCRLAGFSERAYEERHQSFSHQAVIFGADVAIDDGDVSAAADDAGFGFDGAAFDGFEIINFHFDGGDAAAARDGHVGGEAAGGVRERGEDAAVDDAVDLLVLFSDAHAEDDAAGLGYGKAKAELARGVAGVEALLQLVDGEMFDRFE
jgi:hypothetical protein